MCDMHIAIEDIACVVALAGANIECCCLLIYLLYWAVSTAGIRPGKKETNLQN